eukprot:Nk52_evm10s301 gene=Nk52_evmTU10s301
MSSFNVPSAPPDPIFLVTSSFKADTHPDKMNLGVGEEGKPWVLPVVKKVEKMLAEDNTLDHEYLKIDGIREFSQKAAELVLGSDSIAFKENRVSFSQALSGTGSLRLAGGLLAKFYPSKELYISNPTWGNHRAIFEAEGFNVSTYRYFDKSTNGLDFAGLVEDLKEAPNGSVVVLHACAHNPTGVDPTKEQWHQISNLLKEKKLYPIFDIAYQGFASGDFDRDAYGVRYHTANGGELMVAQSFSKNMGLYNERAGNLCIVAETPERATNMNSQVKLIIRAMYSNPPSHGARIAATIMNDPKLCEEWFESVRVMSSRVLQMRKALYKELVALNTPGIWTHILEQIGMFTFTGLNPQQVERLTAEFHIYLLKNGRINMCGINTHNVKYLAKAINSVVTNS